MRQIEGQGTGEAGLAMLVRSELDLIGITGQVAPHQCPQCSARTDETVLLLLRAEASSPSALIR